MCSSPLFLLLTFYLQMFLHPRKILIDLSLREKWKPSPIRSSSLYQLHFLEIGVVELSFECDKIHKTIDQSLNSI